jgi:hypothetical protein
MKSATQYRTDMEIQKKAFRILLREMGLAETLRFHMSYERGRGNYAKDRSRYFKGNTVDELYGEILSQRKKKTVNT